MNHFKSLLVLLTLVLCTSAATAETPLTVRGATTIPTSKAKELFDAGALFVDVRGPSQFAKGRITSAVNLDLQAGLNATSLSALAKKDKEVVFYCDGIECGRSAIAVKLAVGWGYTKTYYYRGGFPAWKREGLPTEP